MRVALTDHAEATGVPLAEMLASHTASKRARDGEGGSDSVQAPGGPAHTAACWAHSGAPEGPASLELTQRQRRAILREAGIAASDSSQSSELGGNNGGGNSSGPLPPRGTAPPPSMSNSADCDNVAVELDACPIDILGEASEDASCTLHMGGTAKAGRPESCGATAGPAQAHASPPCMSDQQPHCRLPRESLPVERT